VNYDGAQRSARPSLRRFGQPALTATTGACLPPARALSRIWTDADRPPADTLICAGPAKGRIRCYAGVVPMWAGPHGDHTGIAPRPHRGGTGVAPAWARGISAGALGLHPAVAQLELIAVEALDASKPRSSASLVEVLWLRVAGHEVVKKRRLRRSALGRIGGSFCAADT
jgi:hypothetical protein